MENYDLVFKMINGELFVYYQSSRMCGVSINTKFGSESYTVRGGDARAFSVSDLKNTFYLSPFHGYINQPIFNMENFGLERFKIFVYSIYSLLKMNYVILFIIGGKRYKVDKKELKHMFGLEEFEIFKRFFNNALIPKKDNICKL